MDATATVTQAAPAFLEVVAHLVQLYHGTIAGLALSHLGTFLVGESAFIAPIAVAIQESVARTPRARLGGCVTAAVAVGEAALIAALAVPIAKVEALTGTLLFAAGARASRAVFFFFRATIQIVGEHAFVAALALSIVTEVETDTTLAPPLRPRGRFLHGSSLVLAAAIGIVAAPSEEIAANFVLYVVTTGIIRPMTEAAAISVTAFTGVAEVEAFPALFTGRRFNRITFRVFEFTVLAETASTVVTE